MVKEFWVNLPVKNIEKSKQFYSAIGFSFTSEYGNTPTSAAMQVGSKDVIVMLFTEDLFAVFSQQPIADTSKESEVLLNIDAESPAEVDELAVKVEKAGGIVFSKPRESQGWMYGCGFADPDGHRWAVLYMDRSKIPTK